MSEEDASQGRAGQLPWSEQVDLVNAFLRRSDPWFEAADMLQRAYPRIGRQQAVAAAGHLYGDGRVGCVQLLADLELSLREGWVPGYGVTLEVLYHFYNWLIFKELLPVGSESLLEDVRRIRGMVAEDDKEAALEALKEVEHRFEGHMNPPTIEPGPV